MLTTSRFSLLLLCVASFATGVLADSIALKSGERIEGKILSETATEMTVQVQISAGITDEKKIPKTEIVKVDRVAADETAFRGIMNLQPGKTSYVTAQYDSIIAALQSFIAQFPDSAHVAEVQATLKTFEAEKKRVVAGEMKFEGIWLSHAAAVKQRVQIGGSQYLAAMKSANASGDAIGALNAFAALEKNFGGAKVLPEAVAFAQQILVALKPAVEQAIVNQKINNAERVKGVAAAGPAQRAELIAAYQREQTQADAAIAAATAAKTWPPFLPSSDKCLAAILTKIPAEAKRLQDMPVAAMRESIDMAEKAQAEFASKNVDAASDMVAEVLKLWPANDLGLQLRAQIAALKVTPRPVPGATPAATPAATPTPGGKIAATPKPNSSPKPVVKTTPEPGPAAVPASPAAKPAEPEEKPFFMTIGGAATIVGVLALILVGANLFNNFRQRRQEPEE
ncbi:MAG: hypothetical protein K8R23_13260 [Chthoniobacter sp.]|nr:hypothetical protein [Chthoniobacter sp.]